MNSDFVNNMNQYEQQQQQQQQQMHQMHANMSNPNTPMIQMQQPMNMQPSSPHHLQQAHHMSHHHHHPPAQQPMHPQAIPQTAHSSSQNMAQYQGMNQYHYHQAHSTPPSPHYQQTKPTLSPYSPHQPSPMQQKPIPVISPSHHYQLSPSNQTINYYQSNMNPQMNPPAQHAMKMNQMVQPMMTNEVQNVDDKNKQMINSNDLTNKLINPPVPLLNKPQLISPQHNYQMMQSQQQQQQQQSMLQQQQNKLPNLPNQNNIKLSPSFHPQQPQSHQPQQPQMQKPLGPPLQQVSYYPQPNSSYQILNQSPTLQQQQQQQQSNLKSPISQGVNSSQQILKQNIMLTPQANNINSNNLTNSNSSNMITNATSMNYYNNNNNNNPNSNPQNNVIQNSNSNNLTSQLINTPSSTTNNNAINNHNKNGNNFTNNYTGLEKLPLNNGPITSSTGNKMQLHQVSVEGLNVNNKLNQLPVRTLDEQAKLVSQDDSKAIIAKTNANNAVETNGLLSNNLAQISSLIDSSLTEEEEEILSEYDCRLYGLLKLENAENIYKKFFIIKAILCYEKRIAEMTEENFKEASDKSSDLSTSASETTLQEKEKKTEDIKKCKYIQLAKLHLSLGHFYLLIYDYSKALECYQKFFKFRINKLQDSIFYYGIGLVYFVFGAYRYAARAFLCALYKDTNFQRVNEIHFRLGIIYKELKNFVLSLKHFKLALIDTSSSLSSVTKSEIKLCIAQLYETNSEYSEAIEKYEELTKSDTTDTNSIHFVENQVRAKALRHLGWIYYYSDKCIDKQQHQQQQQASNENLLSPYNLELKQLQNSKQKQLISSKHLQFTIDSLQKSAQLDSSQNLTWYYLGRALACKGSSREAFVSYKNSVNNPEANGDTWCSIGILYYQQKQYMDSLQAYICAIQLDRSHFSAWLNLGILYEQDNQLDEALKCYKSAALCKNELKRNKKPLPSSVESKPADLDDLDSDDESLFDHRLSKEELKFLKERIKLITSYQELPVDKKKDSFKERPHNLPILEDAFSLQIPTDLRQKIVSNNHLNQINLGLINPSLNASHLKLNEDSLLKHKRANNPSRVLTNLTSNMKSTSQVNSTQAASNSSEQAAKRVKLSKPDQPIPQQQQPILLKQQQIQLMNQLEQNRNHLNPEQLLMLNHLKSQYAAQQQQLSNQQQRSLNNQFPLGSLAPTLNLGIDQLPKDLENVQPITITHDDNSLQDLNTLLSRHDIVEDLRISDDDKGSLDHIFSSFSNKHSLNELLTSKTGSNDDDTNSTSSSESSTFIDKIKLDSSLTNGDNKPSTQTLVSENVLKEKSNDELLKTSLILPVTDDEVLASKLSIKMTAQQILNECKPYGVNGIQTNSFLRPGRLVASKKKMFMHSNVTEEESSDEEFDDLDDTLPNGSLGADANYLKANSISKKNSNFNPPQTPSVMLETKKDALSSHLQFFCLSHPITVVRGLSNVLKLDLGLFSTKSLVEVDPEHAVEVRKQRLQASDENWDAAGKNKHTWRCESSRSFTTLVKYAQYQAHSFQEAVRDEKNQSLDSELKNFISCNKISNMRRKDSLDSMTGNSLMSPSLAQTRKTFKQIKFGTNVDLSDEVKWKTQMQELTKLPPFMRVISSGNMLSHVGYKVYGVNTVQMYLKVPGCRTPGHQENNSFCSLNINIGPGDCEWFGVDDKYWPVIEELCEKNDVDFLNGSWWPNLEELAEARVPVYRFLQKPGDLVWVNAGCVHWVQSVGWCNHISWNIGPLVYLQYKLAIERYEWNKLKFYKSIVPMVHLSWNIARNIKIQDRRLYEYVRYVLMQSLKQSQLAINYVENCGCEIRHQARQADEPAHYCYDCECEVFNILFVSEQVVTDPAYKKSDSKQNAQHVVHCQACARKRSHLLENFVILNQYNMDELKQTYDQFQLYVQSVNSLSADFQ